MSVSTSTISNRSKIKVVFLGDQNTGKTSIIERYINNTFYENPDVFLKIFSQPSVLTLWARTLVIMDNILDYNYGIPQDKKDLEV